MIKDTCFSRVSHKGSITKLGLSIKYEFVAEQNEKLSTTSAPTESIGARIAHEISRRTGTGRHDKHDWTYLKVCRKVLSFGDATGRIERKLKLVSNIS